MRSEAVHGNAATEGAARDARVWVCAAEYIGIAVAYFALAKLGLSLASINPSASPIWPPTGFALAIVILTGNRAGPAIFLAALLANATTAGSIYTSFAIALGNTLEALVGGYLVRRWSDGPRAFASPSGVARFTLIASATATSISAAIGVGSLSIAGYVNSADFTSVLMTWWLGDLASALVITPVIVLWATRDTWSFRNTDLLETALVSVAGVAVGLIAFSPLVKIPIDRRDALAFLAILPLMWAALRGSQRDTATVAIVLSCFAVWGTRFGHGPFARADLNESFLLLVAFMISAAVPSLALSAGVNESRRTEAALRESEARVRTLTDRLPNAAIYQIVDDAGRRFYTYASRGIESLRGVTAEAVLADPLLLRNQVLPQYLEALEAADAESSAKQTFFEHEFEVRLPSGEHRWLHLSSVPRRLADGRTIWDGVQLDITERKRADERQRLLARELDHRAKNLLTVVQSILQLSRAEDVDGFVKAVRGRIMALARAHSLLASNRWEGADLRQLIKEELAPYRTGSGRIAIDGPGVTLLPAASQSIGLALHELATNAAKHGSLTRPTGRLAVTWVANADGLRLIWDESGGPAIAATPTRRGFGSTVIAGSIRQGLHGDLSLEWRPEGLRAVISVPNTQLAGAGATDGARAKDMPKEAATTVLAGRRILIVEDEPLIAMAVAVALTETGCTIVGPAITVAEALPLAEEEQLDAAVLDRNMNGQNSDEVARRLRDRGIPFAVVTGYADAGLPLDFADVPSLTKPFESDDLTSLLARLISASHI